MAEENPFKLPNARPPLSRLHRACGIIVGMALLGGVLGFMLARSQSGHWVTSPMDLQIGALTGGWIGLLAGTVVWFVTRHRSKD